MWNTWVLQKSVTHIDDIGDVDNSEDDPTAGKFNMDSVKDAEVVGVENISRYKSCIKCPGKM